MLALLNTFAQVNGYVSGNLLQYCQDLTLPQVIQMARETEMSNMNRVTISVVDIPFDLGCTTWYNVKRLDTY